MSEEPMKVAVTALTLDAAAAFAVVAEGAGLQILAFLGGDFGEVALAVISGSALPEECGSFKKSNPLSLLAVKVDFHAETYGRQSITKVAGIALTGETIGDLVMRLIP